MIEVFGTTYPVARKTYECNASLFVQEQLEDFRHELSYRDAKAIVLARMEGWKINPGMKYRKYNVKECGDIHWGIRERIDMAKICSKYKLYSE